MEWWNEALHGKHFFKYMRVVLTRNPKKASKTTLKQTKR